MIRVKKGNVERVIHEDSLKRYENEGYSLVEEKTEETVDNKEETVDYSGMVKDELIKIAEEKGFEVNSRMKKEEIIELLNE